jgi:hypothetical protein
LPVEVLPQTLAALVKAGDEMTGRAHTSISAPNGQK